VEVAAAVTFLLYPSCG